MRRLCFVDEKINSFSSIITIFINIFFSFLVYYSVKNYNEELVNYMWVFIILIIIDLFYLIIFIHPKLKIRNKYKNIKKNGQWYEGYIEDYTYERSVNAQINTNDKTYSVYKLRIRYGDNSIFLTPNLGFNPVLALGSRKCDIYVYNNVAYATGFKRRKFGEQKIWNDNNDSVLKEKNSRKQYFEENKLGIIISGCFIAMFIGVVIWQFAGLFIK